MVYTRSKRPQTKTSAKEDANCNSLVNDALSRSSKRKTDILSSEKSSVNVEKSSEKSTTNKITEKPIERPSRRKERTVATSESTAAKEAASHQKAAAQKEKNIPKITTRSAAKKGDNRLPPTGQKRPQIENHVGRQGSVEDQDAVPENIPAAAIKREPEVKSEPVELRESSCDDACSTEAPCIVGRGSARSVDQVQIEPTVLVKTEPMECEESDRPQSSAFSVDQLSNHFSAGILSSSNYRDGLRVRSGKKQLLQRIIEREDQVAARPQAFASTNWVSGNYFSQVNTLFVFGELTRDVNYLEYQREEERMACVGLTRRNYAEQFRKDYAKHKVVANEAYTTERKRSRRRGPVPDYSELASGAKRFPKLDGRTSATVKRNGGNNSGNSRAASTVAAAATTGTSTTAQQPLLMTPEGNANNNSNSSGARAGKGSKSASHSSAEGLARAGRGRGSNRNSRCPSPAVPDDDETDNCELSDEEVLQAIRRETAAEAEADDARRPEQRQRRKVAGMGNFMKWKYCYSDDEPGKRTKRRKPPIEETVEVTPTGARDPPNGAKRQKVAPEVTTAAAVEAKATSEAARSVKRKALKEAPAEPALAPAPAKLTPSKAGEAPGGVTKVKKEPDDKELAILRTKRVPKEEPREEGEVCLPSSSKAARLTELNAILHDLVNSVIKNPAQMEFTYDPPKVRLRNITPDQFCDIVQESATTPFMVHNASTTPVANPNGPGLGLCYHAHIGLRNEDDKSHHDLAIRPERIPSKLPNIRPKLPADGSKSGSHRASAGAGYKSGIGFMPRQRKWRAKIAPRREAPLAPSRAPPPLPSVSRQPPQLAPKPTTAPKPNAAPKPSAVPMPGPSTFDTPGPSIFPRKPPPAPRPAAKEPEKPPPATPGPSTTDAKEMPSTSTGGSTGRILVKATCFQPRRPQTKLEPLDECNSDDSDQLALDADLKHRIISEIPLTSKSMTDSRGLRDAMRRMGRRKTDPDIHPVTRRMNKKVVRKMYTGSECVPSILKRPLTTGALPPSSTSLSPLRPSSGPMPSTSASTCSMRPAAFPRVEYRRPVGGEYRFGSPLKVQLDNRGRYVDPYKPAERHEETPATALTASERLKLKKFNSDEKTETRPNQQKPSGAASSSGGGSNTKSGSSKGESGASSGPAVLARSKMAKRQESGEESDFELSEAHHPFKSTVSPPSSASSSSLSILTPLPTASNVTPSSLPSAKVTPPGAAVSSSGSGSGSASSSVHVKILPKPEGSPARSSQLSARPLIHDKAAAQGGFRRILPRPENALAAGASGTCNGAPAGSGNAKATRAQEHPVVSVSNADAQNISAIQRRPMAVSEAGDAEPPTMAVSPQKHQECQMALLKAILRQKSQMGIASDAPAATTSDSSGVVARRVSAAEAPAVLPPSAAPLTPSRPVAGNLPASSSAGSLRVPPASSYTNQQSAAGAQSPRSNSQLCLNPIRIRMTRLKTPGAFPDNDSAASSASGAIPLGMRSSSEEGDAARDSTSSR